jgi:very-short-patch-repair endonuclease
MTPSERLLWSRLRARQLGEQFRRQTLILGFVVDFYCPRLRFAIEVDGPKHGEITKRTRDAQHDAILYRKRRIRTFRLERRLIERDLELAVRAILIAMDAAEYGDS